VGGARQPDRFGVRAPSSQLTVAARHSATMNKDETLELYARGKDAWNAQAQRMLDQRPSLPPTAIALSHSKARGSMRSRISSRRISKKRPASTI
jgi:hypothetical protein